MTQEQYDKLEDVRRTIRSPRVDALTLWDQIFIGVLVNTPETTIELSANFATKALEYRDKYLAEKEAEAMAE